MTAFRVNIGQLTDKYVRKENMGETAYAFFNVITDYASNSQHVQPSAVNGLQTRCGLWINTAGELVLKPGFSWEAELNDHMYLLN